MSYHIGDPLPCDAVVKCLDSDGGVKGECSLPGNLHFGTTHMLLLEEELPVQVAHINGVQVNLENSKKGYS